MSGQRLINLCRFTIRYERNGGFSELPPHATPLHIEAVPTASTGAAVAHSLFEVQGGGESWRVMVHCRRMAIEWPADITLGSNLIVILPAEQAHVVRSLYYFMPMTLWVPHVREYDVDTNTATVDYFCN